MKIEGKCDDQFKPVKELFTDLHSSGKENGSSFALYKDGKPIIDLWGGYFDAKKTQPWKRNTLATVWSTTKGVAALTCALAVERGLLDYDQKVAHYWPEFSCNGKENITVGMLLSHQAGICGAETMNIEDYYNQELMSSKLANMTPIWQPGTASGYHSMTYGWLVSELILRVTGKNLGTYYQEEISNPNGIDFYIGLPEEEDHRSAEMIPMERNNQKKVQRTEIQKASDLGPNLLAAQNTREWRAAEIASANGQGNASNLAKLYSLVVTNDLSIKILQEHTISKMTSSQIQGRDLVLGVVTSWGAGFVMNMHKIIYGPEENTFGHSGYGGSCAFGDPKNNLGISYVMNKMEGNFAGDSRSIALINKTYECIGELNI
ncbi:MAG: serine hydrolase [SAR86 cluster bacterium]|jgi:CubicO group peptidase (beta-lactamase class C family)|nr:serine hydrolase [SAR86 cluster bacterium]|tara:strand:- start:7714 stop:8841 length:1128 start_codon:yes stop_codon:yes gene_type:complete